MTDTNSGSQKNGHLAIGIGLPTKSKAGKTIEVFYAYLRFQPDSKFVSAVAGQVGYKSGNSCHPVDSTGLLKISEAASQLGMTECSKRIKQIAGTKREVLVYVLQNDIVPTSTEEVYLKLSLISHKFITPLTLNFDNIFELLPNVAWTSDGPMDVEDAREALLQSRLDGKTLQVYSVDKFPKLLGYCIPDHVRVADTARVRLGAYLGEGTTVMQTGLMNFNSGTEGPNMVEGRLSIGVFLGGHSDLGGGASTMSSSKRNSTIYNSIGRYCVIGANGGTGISLGDECTVEAGLYVTAGTKVELLDRTHRRIGTVKARELAGRSNLLFRRNSSTGQVEALESGPTVQMDGALHSNK